MRNKMIFPVVSLLVICLVSAFLLAGTNELTAERIAQAQRQKQQELLEGFFPEADGFAELDGGHYRAEKSGAVLGYAVTVSEKGYGGSLSVLCAFDASGKLLGVTVPSHAETVGVGAKATDSGHLSQYNGKSVSDFPTALGTDIDAVTGATVSSRAINKAVCAAAEIFKELTDEKE